MSKVFCNAGEFLLVISFQVVLPKKQGVIFGTSKAKLLVLANIKAKNNITMSLVQFDSSRIEIQQF